LPPAGKKARIIHRHDTTESTGDAVRTFQPGET